MEEAEKLGSKALATGFRHSGNVDKITLSLFKNLKEDNSEAQYYVCNFCGFVAKNSPPDNCPICTAPKNRFKKIEAGH
jgi:rubrerythrin